MSGVPMFGSSRPRFNAFPLFLTPGFAAIGFAIGGAQAAWWGVAAWLAVVLGAAVSCTLFAWRGAQEEALRAGRRPFDWYDANSAER